MKMWTMLTLVLGMSSAAFAQDFDYRKPALARIRATEICAIDYMGASNAVSLVLEMAMGSGSVSHEEFTQVAAECNAVMKETARKFYEERLVRVIGASRLTRVHASDGLIHRQFVLSRSVTAYVQVEWVLPGLRGTRVGQTYPIGLTGRALEIYLVQKGLGQWSQGREGEWYLVLSPQGAKQLNMLAGDPRDMDVLSTPQQVTEWAKGPAMNYLQEIAKIWKSKF